MLTLTNIVLALLVVGAVLYVVLAPLLDALRNLRRRRAYEAELDRDMEEMFPHRSGGAVIGSSNSTGVSRQDRAPRP